MRLAMCSLHVTDPGAAHRFYTDVLGFETMIAMPEHHVFVITGRGQDVGLLLEPSNHPVASAYRAGLYAERIPALVVGTDDLDADIERLSAQGIGFVSERFTDASGSSINLDDTVGNIIQLHQAAR